MKKLRKLVVACAVITAISAVSVSSAFAADNPNFDYMQSMMQQRVEQGYMTQEQADSMYEYMQENGWSYMDLSDGNNGYGMMGGRGMMGGYGYMNNGVARDNLDIDYMQSMMQQRVEQGYMTQEQADSMYKYMQENGWSCGGNNGYGMMGGRGMMGGYGYMNGGR